MTSFYTGPFATDEEELANSLPRPSAFAPPAPSETAAQSSGGAGGTPLSGFGFAPVPARGPTQGTAFATAPPPSGPLWDDASQVWRDRNNPDVTFDPGEGPGALWRNRAENTAMDPSGSWFSTAPSGLQSLVEASRPPSFLQTPAPAAAPPPANLLEQLRANRAAEGRTSNYGSSFAKLPDIALNLATRETGVGNAIEGVIPGAPGRILGAAAESVTSPLNLLGLGIAGPGLRAGLLGRGALSSRQYLALLALQGGLGQSFVEGGKALGIPDVNLPVVGSLQRNIGSGLAGLAIRPGAPDLDPTVAGARGGRQGNRALGAAEAAAAREARNAELRAAAVARYGEEEADKILKAFGDNRPLWDAPDLDTEVRAQATAFAKAARQAGADEATINKTIEDIIRPVAPERTQLGAIVPDEVNVASAQRQLESMWRDPSRLSPQAALFLREAGTEGRKTLLQDLAGELAKSPDFRPGDSRPARQWLEEQALREVIEQGLPGQVGKGPTISVRQLPENLVPQPPAPRTTNSLIGNVIGVIPALAQASQRIQTSGDIFGAQFRQNLPMAFISPGIWARSGSRALRAFMEDPQASRVMAEIEAMPRFAKDEVVDVGGVKVTIPAMTKVMGIGKDFETPGFERFNNSLLGRLSERFPLSQRSENAQRAALLGAATERRNEMIDAAIKAGITDPAWYDHYGKLARLATGYGDVHKGLQSFTKGFYSLRNIAARFQTAMAPLTMPGAVFRNPLDLKAMRENPAFFSSSPRGQATMQLTRFALGEIANLKLLSAAGQQSGLFQVGWNPLEPGFGVAEIQNPDGSKYSIDLMGGYGSAVKAVTHTLAAAADAQAGRQSRFDPSAEWLAFFRNKATAFPARAIDTFVGVSPGLRKSEALRSPFQLNLADKKTWSTPEGLGGVASMFLPFPTAEVLQNALSPETTKTPDGLWRSGLAGLAQTVGAPVNLYDAPPGSKAVQEAVARQEVPATYKDASGQDQPVRTLDDLKNADPNVYDEFLRKNPGLAERAAEEAGPTSQRVKEITDLAYSQQSARDTDLLASDPAKWREETSRAHLATQSAIAERARDWGNRDLEEKSLLDKALGVANRARDAATDPRTGAVDYDKVEREVAKLSQDEQDLLFKSRLRNETPEVKQYYRDLKTLDEYFNQRDLAWKETQQQLPRYAEYTSYDDLIKKETDRVMAANNGQANKLVIQADLEKAYASVAARQTNAATNYLRQHQDLVPLLAKYDFWVPAALRGAAR